MCNMNSKIQKLPRKIKHGKLMPTCIFSMAFRKNIK